MIGGFTDRTGRGIARTCGCGGGGVELSFVGPDEVDEAGDMGLISAALGKVTDGFEWGDSLRELDIFVGLCEEEREGGGERGRDIVCWWIVYGSSGSAANAFVYVLSIFVFVNGRRRRIVFGRRLWTLGKGVY
jgi:hypothetical protein